MVNINLIFTLFNAISFVIDERYMPKVIAPESESTLRLSVAVVTCRFTGYLHFHSTFNRAPYCFIMYSPF